MKIVNKFSSSGEKVELFMRLFRGRDDVYARWFESAKSGKSGYSPVCENEWREGICLKPKVKCAQCKFRKFVPVTKRAIEAHLLGQSAGRMFVMGIYPLLLDEQCWFVAADFDGEEWQRDVSAVRECASEAGFEAAVESICHRI